MCGEGEVVCGMVCNVYGVWFVWCRGVVCGVCVCVGGVVCNVCGVRDGV